MNIEVQDLTNENKEISSLGVVYVTGSGAELPSHRNEAGEIEFIRDADGGIGILLVLAGDAQIADAEAEGVRMNVTVKNYVSRFMLNPRTTGRIIALLHELSVISGTADEMHESLDRNRAELKEKLAGIDISHMK